MFGFFSSNSQLIVLNEISFYSIKTELSNRQCFVKKSSVDLTNSGHQVVKRAIFDFLSSIFKVFVLFKAFYVKINHLKSKIKALDHF